MGAWLITGCSSGLGRALAETLLEKGHDVAATARNPEKLADLVEAHPEHAAAFALDVTDRASIDEAVALATERFGAIDVLVNNAGYCLRGAVEECTPEEIQAQFDTNFFGPVALIQRVLPAMRAARKGAIVNYSSIAALNTSAGSAFYGASKAAIEAMSDGLRDEVSPLGIKVMIVEPGPFATDFYNRSLNVNENDISDYAATAGARKVRQEEPGKGASGWGSTKGAAEAVISAIESEEPPLRLLLGATAIASAERLIATKQGEIETWRETILISDK